MKTLVYRLALALSGFAFTGLQAQFLDEGSILFVAYHTDLVDLEGYRYGDGFSFVCMEPLPANTRIIFTEQGWSNASGWWEGDDSFESHIEYLSPDSILPKGTVISIHEDLYTQSIFHVLGPSAQNVEMVFGEYWNLFGGDNLFAYQVSQLDSLDPNPHFLAGIYGNFSYSCTDANGWATSISCAASITQESELPDGLTPDFSALVLYTSTEKDNAIYSGPVYCDEDSTRDAIMDRSQWTTSDVDKYPLNPSVFNFWEADTIPPVAIAKDTTLYLEADGGVSLEGYALDSESTDNCGVESFALSQSVYDCGSLGTNEIVFYA